MIKISQKNKKITNKYRSLPKENCEINSCRQIKFKIMT